MSVNQVEFREWTFFLFFVYLFYETRIYLVFWAALFLLLQIILYLYGVSTTTYKGIIASYIFILILGYLYKFRKVLFDKESVVGVSKLRTLSLDRTKTKKISVAILLLLLINVVAVLLFGQ